MQVGVTYSEPGQQLWLNIEVPEGTTVREAVARSGILVQFPHIDLEAQKVGIFGRLVKIDTASRRGRGRRLGVCLTRVAPSDSPRRRRPGCEAEHR